MAKHVIQTKLGAPTGEMRTDRASIEKQAEQTMDNIAAILEATAVPFMPATCLETYVRRSVECESA